MPFRVYDSGLFIVSEVEICYYTGGSPLYKFGATACNRSANFLSGCDWILSALRIASTLNKKGRSSKPRVPSNSGFFLRRSPRVSPPCRSFDGSVGCVPIHSWGYMYDASVGRTEGINEMRRSDPQKEMTTDLRVRLLLVDLETWRRNAGVRSCLGGRSQLAPVIILRIRLECENTRHPLPW